MNTVLTTTLKAVRMNTVSVGSVFCHRQGTLYRSFRTALERAVRKAGVGDFTLHDLRHTLASRLVIVGGHLPTIQDLMGHKNISMTLRSTHLSSDHKQRAVHVLSTWTEVFLPSPSTGEGEGGGEVGSQPDTLGHPFPPIPTFPRQGGRRGKPVQKFMSQYLEQFGEKS